MEEGALILIRRARFFQLFITNFEVFNIKLGLLHCKTIGFAKSTFFLPYVLAMFLVRYGIRLCYAQYTLYDVISIFNAINHK